METKICNGFLCKGVEKSIDEFGLSNGKHKYICRKCHNEGSKIYRKNNKEKICRSQKLYRINNIEKLKLKSKKYNTENSEKIKLRYKNIL
jgi:hypothetical protein